VKEEQDTICLNIVLKKSISSKIMKTELSEKWIKASIAGTIWAASEIVLGSFLHNIKIPFSGNILTAIGIIVLISISYTWTDKGLFWRAGLICAIMKTMSPSAVIFGPMIAIISEAFLLETAVRLLGRTFAGYIVGAMLAMSWNLFQKIANYIIFYGSNIIEVYTDLLKMAQKQLNIHSDIVWLPIIILLIVYSLFGLFAAIIGIKVGRKLLEQPRSGGLHGVSNDFLKDRDSSHGIPGHHFNYSIKWLFFNIFLILGSFILLNYTSWIIWSLSLTAIIVIWSLRYNRALRQLSKPKFWFFFVFITLLTAFVFTKAQSGKDVLKEGLLTGIQMNFRAVIIIVGFSVLGTELYNPRIRNFFLRTSFKHFPLALELSVESLPSVIAGIPDFKSLIRNPVAIFYQVISNADKRLAEIKSKTGSVQKVFIISGAVGAGKTTFTKKLVDIFKKNGISVGGILSERVMVESGTIGYDLTDIETNETEVLLRQGEGSGKERIGRFEIFPDGFEKGSACLSSSRLINKRIVIVDEVGILELENRGWSDCIQDLIKVSGNHLLITVRDSLIEAVIEKWKFKNTFIYNVSEIDYNAAGSSIMKEIN
jgi:nucleoside-triphosphatase THEP1